MLLALSAVCLGLAALSAVRWSAARVDALGRVRRFPVVGVVVPVLLAVGLVVPVVRQALLERTLSAVASQLAGRPVTVDCRSGGAELVHVGSDLGRVEWGPDGRPADETVLARSVCADLARWRRGLDDRQPERPDDRAAVAVHVLTHEAMHLSGLLDEAEAECAAVQRDARTARLLGASPEVARRLARTYWLVAYHRTPEVYRTPGCAAGQRFDEGLPDAPWLTDVP